MRIDRRQTTHNFEKQNLVTVRDRTGTYDFYKCSLCGLTGKQYFMGIVTVSDRIKSTSAMCPKSKIPQRIRITQCRAIGKAFDNLTPGSVHDVIETPEGELARLSGVWVMGVGEPVKVLVDEYEEE